MTEGKLINLIQICNQKIIMLNSQLEDSESKSFYQIQHGNVSRDQIQRIVHDLDLFILESETDESSNNIYLDLRSKLMKIEELLEENHSVER